MVCLEGMAKHSRRQLLELSALTAHSGPGLNTIPAAAAGLTRVRTSILAGSLIQRKMPPLGAQHSADDPNSFATASVIVCNLPCSTPLRYLRWSVKCAEKYSATTI